jgi:predicted dehydrogenase
MGGTQAPVRIPNERLAALVLKQRSLPMAPKSRLTRRGFLQAAATALAAPAFVPASALGRDGKTAASERITVGFIGCGKMANDYHLSTLLSFGDVQAVAVCEVDRNRREHAKQRVEKAYQGKSEYKGCAAYSDFRELLARKDIDAVCIATPEHWHAIPIIEACKAGKDVYCEKPMTLTLAEAKRCLDAVRKHERVFQTGSQQRSSVFGPFRKAAEIVRSGRLGKIQTVTVGVGGPSRWCDLPAETAEPGLDWDVWLGPAPMRPYHSALSPRGVHNHFPAWRSYREYAGGGHSDMGAHHYDIAQWCLGMDESGPVEIIPPDDPKATTSVRYVYANAVRHDARRPQRLCLHRHGGEAAHRSRPSEQ